MLTMAIEDPPLTRRRPFIDGILRLVAATGLIASLIGFGYLVVVASVDHSLFDEWQVIFAAVSLAAILVGLGLGSWFLLRSRPIGASQSSQSVITISKLRRTTSVRCLPLRSSRRW